MTSRSERVVFKAASGMPGWCVHCERKRTEHVDREPGTAAHFGYCPVALVDHFRISLKGHKTPRRYATKAEALDVLERAGWPDARVLPFNASGKIVSVEAEDA